MHRRERAGDGEDDLHGRDGPEALLPGEDVAERLALEQLHDQEGVALGRVADVVDLHDGRMVDARRRPRLPDQPLAGLGHVDGGLEELERHVDVEPKVVRDPHDAHATLVELLDQEVAVRDHLAGRVGEPDVHDVQASAGRRIADTVPAVQCAWAVFVKLAHPPSLAHRERWGREASRADGAAQAAPYTVALRAQRNPPPANR